MRAWMKALALAAAIGIPVTAWAAMRATTLSSDCPCHCPICPLRK